jgi:acetyl esterase/lipase
MAPIWSSQPFKGLFTACIIGIAPIYFSLLSLYYIPQGLRPHPKWSLRTTLGQAFYYHLFKYAAKVRMVPQYATKDETLKDRVVMVKTAPSQFYTGVLEHPTIKPVPFGAIWFPEVPTADDIQSRKFILHLPGGAYVIASPPSQTGIYPSMVFKRGINAITFYAQYRVAATSEERFPAALQDAVTFYAYLLELGIPAKNIIVSGDSAGGNLVLALLRYIEDSKNILPRPRGAIAWSPWVNVSASAIAEYGKSANFSTDLVPCSILEWGLEAYPPGPLEDLPTEIQAYISPAQHPFTTGTPLVLQAGSLEVFRKDISTLAHEMAALPGNKVKYYETPNAPHDLALCGGILGLEQQTVDAIEAADEYFITCKS